MPGSVIKTYLLSNHERSLLEAHNWLGLLDHHDLSRIRKARSKRRNEFMLSRTLLRYVIGQTIPGIDAASVEILERQHVPPVVGIAEDHGLRFNISHSGDWVGVAVSADFPGGVGLDIEQEKPDRKLLETAAAICSNDQMSALQAAAADDAAELVTLFYRYWTRKEAALKSRGLGIGAVRLGDIVDIVQPTGSSASVWSGRLQNHAMAVAAASEFELEVVQVRPTTNNKLLRLEEARLPVTCLAVGPVAVPAASASGGN